MYTDHNALSRLMRARRDEDHHRAREHSLSRSLSPPGPVRRTAARTLLRAAARLDRDTVRRASV